VALAALADGDRRRACRVHERCLDGLGRYVESLVGAVQEALAAAPAGAQPRRVDRARELAATVAGLPADLRPAAAAAGPAWAPVLGPLAASTTRRCLYYDPKPANFLELPGHEGRLWKIDTDLMLHTSTVAHQAVVAVFTYPIPRLAPTERATYRSLRDLTLAWLGPYDVAAEELDLQLAFHLCRRVLAKAGRAPHQARALAPYALLALESMGGGEARTLGALVERAAA
jgi:hypothetical protein